MVKNIQSNVGIVNKMVGGRRYDWKSWEFYIIPWVSADYLINDGAESLKRLRDKIVQKSDEKAPSFLLVLTAVGAAYKREDGVYQLLSAEDVLEVEISGKD